MKKTLIIGASDNPVGKSFWASQKLKANNVEVVLIGNKKNEVGDEKIQGGFPKYRNDDIVSI